MAYKWFKGIAEDKKAVECLENGITANPTSPLLNFAHVEYLESEKKYDAVHAHFVRFIEILLNDLNLLQSKISGHCVLAVIQKSPPQTTAGTYPVNDFDQSQKEYTLVWVKFMQFAYRTDGLQAVETIFKQAKVSSYITWEIYEATGGYRFKLLFSLSVWLTSLSNDSDVALSSWRQPTKRRKHISARNAEALKRS
jgi:hypothetical protein